MTDEEWRPVPTWEGLYEVSSSGRIRSLPRVRGRRSWPGCVLQGAPRHRGHLVVSLRDAPRHDNVYIHRIVAEVFIPNESDDPFVLHYDDNPENNAVSNLRWGTPKGNAEDRSRNGGDRNSQKTHCPQGHSYNEENTRVSRGSRFCRTCDRDKAREKRRNASS